MMERWLPDAFIFVIVLTLVAAAAAMLTQGTHPVDLIQMWGNGFWRKILARMAGLAKSRGAAIVLVTVVSLAASWINWGFGLVVGAIFAKEIARQTRVDYRLLVASAYSGFIIWHGGISGSIPLTIATSGHFTESQIGVIPTSQTIFASWNLMIVAALFLLVPLANRLMLPLEHEQVLVDPENLRDRETAPRSALPTPAERLETSPLLMYLIGIPGLAWLMMHFLNGGALNLNIVNFMFLFLGIICHGSARSLLAALDEGVRGGAGIVIQFPFYAGIMAIMVQSGLAANLSEWFVSISTATTLPFWSFISAGIVNIFVPSGGGQWAVQAPVMLPAAEALGADVAKVAMGVAWGDAWTNMLQPFWALPMLGIAGLKARDIMGFCVIQLLVVGIVVGGILYYI